MNLHAPLLESLELPTFDEAMVERIDRQLNEVQRMAVQQAVDLGALVDRSAYRPARPCTLSASNAANSASPCGNSRS